MSTETVAFNMAWNEKLLTVSIKSTILPDTQHKHMLPPQSHIMRESQLNAFVQLFYMNLTNCQNYRIKVLQYK